jgi:flagellar M-ring protein FliF
MSPPADVDVARMRVASGGALGYGSVGYEIFDQTDALGTTSFVQNVNARRALEGELARSINTLANVSAARVHLVLPERRLFSRDAQEPSASVVISVKGQMSSGPCRDDPQSGRDRRARPVPDPHHAGRRHRPPVGEPVTDDDAVSSAALEDRRADVEERLRTRILNIVEGVVGPGAARVAVTAELDRESSTSTRLEYDPNLQVEISRRSETQSSEEPLNDGAVSVSENQPEGGDTTAAEPQLARSSSEVTERNFENSSTQTTTVREAGEVASLSVSVVVDEIATRGEDGAFTFEPRSAEQMAQIERLVAAAVGFPLDVESRAASQILQVDQMRFSRPDLTLGTPAPTGFSIASLDFMRIAEIAVLFITALLIIFLVARPLIKGAVGGGVPARAGAGAGLSALPAAAQAAMLPTDGEETAMLPSADGQDEENIDIAQIDGQVKKSSLRKVASLVDQHPDETVSILRTWMHENAS